MTSVEHNAAAGAAIYGPVTLRAYDLVVHGLSNRFAWRCPTRLMMDMYARNVSEVHLDVGVGSGYFLDNCRFPTQEPKIALLDLSPGALKFTSERIARHRPATYQANVLEPLALDIGPFRSIALMYLLHCLPGTLETKARVFDHLGPYLEEDGVLFGATILGVGVEPSLPGRALMRAYNARGIFGNSRDSLRQLEEGLRHRFEEHSVDVHGCVALFEARGHKGANLREAASPTI